MNPFVTPKPEPSLYGLSNSNRDFRKAQHWGKNIFNNAFPVALACYMDFKNIPPIYFTLNDEGKLYRETISVDKIFGTTPASSHTYFAFESDFVPYQPFVVGNLPRADLVVIDRMTGLCTNAIEIKLTALPDNSTFNLPEERYGCELVIRPDTIIYLALSIAEVFKTSRDQLLMLFHKLPKITDWSDMAEVSPVIVQMAAVLDELMVNNLSLQRPLVMQPIWKTQGKRQTLHQDAFDIFVWSNFAFTRLFFRESNLTRGTISRGARSIAWLTKMLYDFAVEGKIDYGRIIDRMSFNTANDKAFAVNGMITQPLMSSPELVTPRIKKWEIKNIILGGGEVFLSPERRLDAAILNTPGLFD